MLKYTKMEKSKSQFKIGDKVLCVNDAFSVRDPQVMFMNFPKKGKTYTVRGFCSMGSSMHLEEIRNEPLPGRNEIWFYIWHFSEINRSIQSKKVLELWGDLIFEFDVYLNVARKSGGTLSHKVGQMRDYQKTLFGRFSKGKL